MSALVWPPIPGTRSYQVRHRSIPTAAQVGARYGRWLVLAEATPANKKTRWHCRCECGTVRVVTGHNLSLGASTSCGCTRRKPARGRHPSDVWPVSSVTAAGARLVRAWR